MTRALLLAAAFIVAASAVVGCSSEEKRFDVSGTVTYQGQGVPKGLIFFDPTDGGPQGFANIQDGKYDTAAQGKGIRGGKYSVRVNGFDGKEAAEAPFGQPLFLEHTFTKELPAQSQTFDYEVPKAKKVR